MWNEPTDGILATIPKLYETEHIPLDEKVIHLHFFLGGCDWYIAEYDGQDTFFGFVILNDDYRNAEWGYISFSELREIRIHGWAEVDNDLYWVQRPVSEISKISQLQKLSVNGGRYYV